MLKINFYVSTFLFIIFSFSTAIAAGPNIKNIAVSATVDENLLITQNNNGYLASTNNQNGLSAISSNKSIISNNNAGEIYIAKEKVDGKNIFLTNNY